MPIRMYITSVLSVEAFRLIQLSAILESYKAYIIILSSRAAVSSCVHRRFLGPDSFSFLRS